MEISTKKEVVIVAIFAFLIDMNVIGAVLTLLSHSLVHYVLAFMAVFYFIVVYFALKWMCFDKN